MKKNFNLARATWKNAHREFRRERGKPEPCDVCGRTGWLQYDHLDGCENSLRTFDTGLNGERAYMIVWAELGRS